eukprot:gene13557-biopygen10410
MHLSMYRHVCGVRFGTMTRHLVRNPQEGEPRCIGCPVLLHEAICCCRPAGDGGRLRQAWQLARICSVGCTVTISKDFMSHSEDALLKDAASPENVPLQKGMKGTVKEFSEQSGAALVHVDGSQAEHWVQKEDLSNLDTEKVIPKDCTKTMRAVADLWKGDLPFFEQKRTPEQWLSMSEE